MLIGLGLNHLISPGIQQNFNGLSISNLTGERSFFSFSLSFLSNFSLVPLLSFFPTPQPKGLSPYL